MRARFVRAKDAAARVLDAAGLLVLPGLVELHVQGAGGFNIIAEDPARSEVGPMARKLAQSGTTAFLATTAFDMTLADVHYVRHILHEAESPGEGAARILGIHLEGPFISLQQKGMIQERFICSPDVDLYRRIRDLCGGRLRMMTIAPEVDGALEIIEEMAAGGQSVPTLGHTDATYEQAMLGIRAGLRHVCHTCNAMRSIHHRDPGALGAALMTGGLTLQVICDGIHVHPAMVEWIVRLKGIDRCAIITDGVGATGLPPGRYVYAGREYAVEGGACRHASGRLIGTAMTQLQMVKKAVEMTGRPLHEVVRMASLTPAAVLGADDRLGSLEAGKLADLLICDDALNLKQVFIGGRRVV